MEKFKRYTDAATGINPFVFPIGASSWLSVVIGVLFFPFRLILALLIAIVLFLIDIIFQSFRAFGISFIVVPIFHPIMSALVRVFLIVIGNVTVHNRHYPPRKSTSAMEGGKFVDELHTTPKAGDIVVCNMQSLLDVLVLSALGTTGGWRLPSCICVFHSHKEPHCVEFGPSPFQRWQVLRHIRFTGSSTYLKPASHSTSDVDPGSAQETIDLTRLQKKASKLGVPLLFFPEGTCSNGKGVLRFPNIACTGRLHIVSLKYSSPGSSMHIISHTDFMTQLFRLTSGLYGAFGGANAATVTILRPSYVPPVPANGLPFSAAATRDLREKVCQGVTYGNPNVVCKPLDSGVAEKYEFSEQWARTMPGGGKGERN